MYEPINDEPVDDAAMTVVLRWAGTEAYRREIERRVQVALAPLQADGVEVEEHYEDMLERTR